MPATSMLYFTVYTKDFKQEKGCPPPPLAEPLAALRDPPPRTVVCHVVFFCSLVPVLVRHGGHSVLHLLHFVYARLLVLVSINSLTGSVLKNCNTVTSNGTSFP